MICECIRIVTLQQSTKEWCIKAVETWTKTEFYLCHLFDSNGHLQNDIVRLNQRWPIYQECAGETPQCNLYVNPFILVAFNICPKISNTLPRPCSVEFRFGFNSRRLTRPNLYISEVKKFGNFHNSLQSVAGYNLFDGLS